MPEEFEDWVMCKLKETANGCILLVLITLTAGFIAWVWSHQGPFGTDPITTFCAMAIFYIVGILHGVIIVKEYIEKRIKENQYDAA